MTMGRTGSQAEDGQSSGRWPDDDSSGVVHPRQQSAGGSGIHVVEEDRWQIAWDPQAAGAWLRFRCAWAAARAQPDSQVPGKSGLLAAHLGVHPTALSRTNFKLATTALERAAAVFGVTPAFLRDGSIAPPPVWLHHHVRVAALVRRAAARLAQDATVIGPVEPLAEEILLSHEAEQGLAALPEATEHARDFRLLWRVAAAMVSDRLQSVPVDLDHDSWRTIQQALRAALVRRGTTGDDDPVVQALLVIRRAVAQAVRGAAR